MRGSRRADSAHPSPTPSTKGDAKLSTLTPREREVLDFWLQLLNPKAVAKRLGTRPQTVRNQLAAIQHKLGTRSHEELIAKVLGYLAAAPPA
ncbi:MAG: helix-turn-helix transcriptional regulator [Planctomycetaceae bacterium]|nr:helix-turn-helix transcriptional regulator [Planctomycetaceae bacterium]